MSPIKEDGASFISIHAPPRGATCSSLPNSLDRIIFQFTPLREGRHDVGHLLATQHISIHAPPRGATFVNKE